MARILVDGWISGYVQSLNAREARDQCRYRSRELVLINGSGWHSARKQRELELERRGPAALVIVQCVKAAERPNRARYGSRQLIATQVSVV